MNTRETEQADKFNFAIEEDSIICLSLSGRLEGLNIPALHKWADNVHHIIKQQYNKKKIVRVLVDVSKVTGYASDAMTILARLMRANAQYVFKTATFGANHYIAMAQNIVSMLSGRRNFKTFATREEAKSWLLDTSD